MAPHRLGKIKAVIFDCDGTLVDSEHAHFLAWQGAIQKQGGDLSLEEYYTCIGKPGPVIADLLAEKVKADCAHAILQAEKLLYFQLVTSGHPPIQHTMDFLRRLAQEKHRLGLQLALASAGTKKNILLNLRHHDIEHLFDLILSGQDDLQDYSDPEGVNKPKPYIYLHAAKHLNLTPAERMVIEDSHSGVTAGTSAGCFTIAVPNPYTRFQDLSHAHLQLDSFSEVSVAQVLNLAEHANR